MEQDIPIRNGLCNDKTSQPTQESLDLSADDHEDVSGSQQQQQQRQTTIHFTFPQRPVIHSGYSYILDNDDEPPSFCERFTWYVDDLINRYTEWVEQQKVQMHHARRVRAKSRPLAEIPFCIATACAIYGTFLHVRGLAVNGWVVDHSEWDGTGHSFDRNPIVSMSTDDMIIVSIGLACGIMTWFLLVARTRLFVYYVSKWGVWLAAVQASACLTSVYMFWAHVSNVVQDPNHVYSRGFWSCFSAGIMALLAAFGFAIDWLLAYPSSTALSSTLKAMVLPAVMVCSTVIIGASAFMVLEDWTYSESLVFCWVAVTTIGYGDISPETALGRGFFIGYTIVGISVVGYMLLSIRAVITGSSSDILKVNLVRVESLQDYSRKQHQKWLHHHQQHEQTNNSSSFAAQQDNTSVSYKDPRLSRRRTTTNTSTVARPRSLSQVSTFSTYTISNIVNDKDRQILVQVITRSGIARMTFILILCWFGGAGVFCLLEEDWTYLDGLYFAFCTQLTIGFGDIVPQTALAQEFWLVYIVISIAVAAYFISLFGDALVEKLQIQHDDEDTDDDENSDFVETPTSENGITAPGYFNLDHDLFDEEDVSQPESIAYSRPPLSNRSLVGSMPNENRRAIRRSPNDERAPLVRYASMPSISESPSSSITNAKTRRRPPLRSAPHPLRQCFEKTQRECYGSGSTASVPSSSSSPSPFFSQPKYDAVEESSPIVRQQGFPLGATKSPSQPDVTDEELLPDTISESSIYKHTPQRSAPHSGPKKNSKYIPVAIAPAKNHH